MSNHTPGPWKEEAAHLSNELLDKNNNYRSIYTPQGFFTKDSPNGFELTGFIRPEDARLIAAAPEMYNMLRAIADGVAVEDDQINQLLHKIDTP